MSVRVKLCGLTSLADVDAAVEAGADAIGLVFAPSPRQVAGAHARRLFERIPPTIERIAVVARPAPGELREIARLPFDGIQAEAAACARLPGGDAFQLPAFLDGVELLEELARHLSSPPAPRGRARPGSGLRGAFLLDGPRGGGRGSAPDAKRATLAARCGPLVLAGGLRPDTVARAIRTIQPCAVDVSSGIERSPGVKDPELIHAFVAAARRASVEVLS